MESRDVTPKNLYRKVFIKRALGVGALIAYFSVMMLLILGITHAVQGQPTNDSLAYADSSPVEPSNTPAERASGAVRMPLNSSAVWRENFGRQSAISLRMSGTAAKGNALQNLIIFAAHHGDGIDLSDAVPALLAIYEWDSNDRFQTMALAALHAIGDEEGMERVLELFADPYFRHQRISPRLRHITHAALADYLQARKD